MTSIVGMVFELERGQKAGLLLLLTVRAVLVLTSVAADVIDLVLYSHCGGVNVNLHEL